MAVQPPNPQQEATFNSVLDGSAATKLRALKASISANDDSISTAKYTISRLPAGPDRDQKQKIVNAAAASQAAAQRSLQDAIEAHNQLARAIGTATGQNVGLAGMGVLPLIGIGVWEAVALLVAVAVLVNALTSGISAAYGKDVETKGYIEQIADVAKGGASLLGSLGWLALIGIGGFVIWKFVGSRKAAAQ